MAINKVNYNGRTLIDLTEDTVTSETLLEGQTAHDKSGQAITGSLSMDIATSQEVEDYFDMAEEDKHLKKSGIANNLTTTEAGKVLDARQGKTLADKLDATQSDIAIIIEGNQTTHTGGVAVGEYVIVRNSTISGIADGLYKAAQTIPANTAITSAYLAAVDGGLGGEVALLNASLCVDITNTVTIDTSKVTIAKVYRVDKIVFFSCKATASSHAVLISGFPTEQIAGATFNGRGYISNGILYANMALDRDAVSGFYFAV